MAYHLTRERRFAERAAREMCAVSDFSDWNPSHFLDVAEMTLALAVGYDWLYDMLDDEQRLKIRSAIIEKGIKPSFSGRHWWITGKNNWNQVCHAGMVAGALAVADSEPELAEKTILRAIRNLPRSMKASFSPNGAYPEGPTYWGYGTEFTVVLLALLEGAFGQDFGLSEIPGFSVTGDFVIASTAPTGELFNYADCGKRLGSSFAMHWLIRRFNRPDWFSKNERKALKREAERRPRTLKNSRNRLLPLSLLYLQDWTETASRNLVFTAVIRQRCRLRFTGQAGSLRMPILGSREVLRRGRTVTWTAVLSSMRQTASAGLRISEPRIITGLNRRGWHCGTQGRRATAGVFSGSGRTATAFSGLTESRNL